MRSARNLLIAGLIACLAASSALAQSIQFNAGQIMGNSTAAQRPGRAETVTAILDRALGSTRGSILERGASGWAAVGPGATAGLAWISGGAGADPAYGVLGLSGGGCNAALTASNGGVLYSTASACSILAGTATARLPLLSGANATPVWGAYTLPASVTSGGVACFTSASAQASSSLLTANALILGGGSGVCPGPMASLGTTTTVLHGNAAGAPTFAGVSLTADVTGQLPFANGGCNGTSQQTCLNNTMPTPTRAGDVVYYNGTNWVALAGNNSGNQVLQENASGVPSWATVSGTGTVTSVTCGTGLSGGTFTVTGTCGVALTNLTNVLGADVLLNNTANYFDGPSVAQGTSGTWFASGSVQLIDTNGVANIGCKLWDGTTVISSGLSRVTAASTVLTSLTLSGIIASPAANIRISCKDSTSTGGKILFNNSGESKDATVSVFRIQ